MYADYVDTKTIKAALLVMVVVGTPLLGWLLMHFFAARKIVRRSEHWVSALMNDTMENCQIAFEEVRKLQLTVLRLNPEMGGRDDMLEISERMQRYTMVLANPPSKPDKLDIMGMYDNLLMQIEEDRERLNAILAKVFGDSELPAA